MSETTSRPFTFVEEGVFYFTRRIQYEDWNFIARRTGKNC
jgi:hypothetical protein